MKNKWMSFTLISLICAACAANKAPEVKETPASEEAAQEVQASDVALSDVEAVAYPAPENSLSHLKQAFRTAADQYKPCLRHSDCEQMCDAMAGWTCSARCTADDQCEDGFACREDGRCERPKLVFTIGIDDSKTIAFRTKRYRNCNFTIEWGDGAVESFDTCPKRLAHTYASAGDVTIAIGGTVDGWMFQDEEREQTKEEKMSPRMAKQLKNIASFGNTGLGKAAFYGIDDVPFPEDSMPNAARLTDMSYLFAGGGAFNQAAIGKWDTSNVTDMHSMFDGKFNQDISKWDTSKVTEMSFMFSKSSFNQDISGWDTSNVKNMSLMFYYAPEFNQDISKWDTSRVTNMRAMFEGATAFNQDISKWNTSNVEDMSRMFEDASSFNQDISKWDMGRVETMSFMFEGATSFDQDLSGWNLSNTEDINMKDFYKNSGISKENYCKAVQNHAVFKAHRKVLGKSMSCE